MFVPLSKPYRVRVKPYDVDHIMSSPWCRHYEGQIGEVVEERWVMARVRFNDGQTHSITYHSLELAE